MDRDVASFIDDLTNEKLEHKTVTATLADVLDDPASQLQPIYEFVEELVNTGKVGYGELRVDDADLVISLETNLINLPLQEVKRIDKMISDNETLPLNIYLVMSSPFVNASNLRIDQVATADEFIGHLDTYVPTMNSWVTDHLEDVQDNMKAKAAAEAEEAANKKKKSTTKATKTTKKAKATSKK